MSPQHLMESQNVVGNRLFSHLIVLGHQACQNIFGTPLLALVMFLAFEGDTFAKLLIMLLNRLASLNQLNILSFFNVTPLYLSIPKIFLGDDESCLQYLIV